MAILTTPVKWFTFVTTTLSSNVTNVVFSSRTISLILVALATSSLTKATKG